MLHFISFCGLGFRVVSSPHRFTLPASSARAKATANARTHASVTPTHEPRLPPLQQCYQSPYQTFQLSIQAGSASSIAKHAPLTKRACTLSRRSLRSATIKPTHAPVLLFQEYIRLTHCTCAVACSQFLHRCPIAVHPVVQACHEPGCLAATLSGNPYRRLSRQPLLQYCY
jgi:hypothetical protein